MTCCQVQDPKKEGTKTFFSKYAGMYARKFRRRGLERTQKLLAEGIRKEGFRGRQVLDIGCGVGALHLTLLKEGAAKSTGIDMSEGMIESARAFSRDMNLADQTDYIVGDFVELAGTLGEADITLLDKVVCCYEDVDALVETSASKTKKLYALSHPKENLLTKIAFKGHIAIAKLFRWKFHPFWHDWTKLKNDVLQSGFDLVYSEATLTWQVLVFKRKEDPALS